MNPRYEILKQALEAAKENSRQRVDSLLDEARTIGREQGNVPFHSSERYIRDIYRLSRAHISSITAALLGAEHALEATLEELILRSERLKMPLAQATQEKIRNIYQTQGRPRIESLLVKVEAHYSSQEQGDAPELTELRELTVEEARTLQQIVTLKLSEHPPYKRPKEAGELPERIGLRWYHDYPHLAGTIAENIPQKRLVVAALGKPSPKLPHLQFEAYTLLGWYDLEFIETARPAIPIAPDKKGLSSVMGIVYTVPECRKQRIASQLVHFMELCLKKRGYGNIEVRAENPLLRQSLLQKGYREPGGSYRMNKTL